MGKVKSQLWDDDYVDDFASDNYLIDYDDDDLEYVVSPTEDICGIGIDTYNKSNVYYDVDEQNIAQQIGADVLQKINKTVEEMGGSFYDEIPF